MENSKIQCPSYHALPGAELFGVMNDNNEISFLSHPIKIDADFISEASKKGEIENRFRFTGKCAQDKCQQWKDNKCSLSQLTLDTFDESDKSSELPPCPIRVNCRWYLQEGESICYLCSKVVRL